jgi:hypothetical protein
VTLRGERSASLNKFVSMIFRTAVVYFTESRVRLRYKHKQLMLYREIVAVCSEIHTKHVNTLCGQNVELLNVKDSVRTAQ